MHNSRGYRERVTPVSIWVYALLLANIQAKYYTLPPPPFYYF